MDKNHYEKQKATSMCNEMLELINNDDVVYSIRETNTGTNIAGSRAGQNIAWTQHGGQGSGFSRNL